jgi:hypothetical protein
MGRLMRPRWRLENGSRRVLVGTRGSEEVLPVRVRHCVAVLPNMPHQVVRPQAPTHLY